MEPSLAPIFVLVESSERKKEKEEGKEEETKGKKKEKREKENLSVPPAPPVHKQLCSVGRHCYQRREDKPLHTSHHRNHRSILQFFAFIVRSLRLIAASFPIKIANEHIHKYDPRQCTKNNNLFQRTRRRLNVKE